MLAPLVPDDTNTHKQAALWTYNKLGEFLRMSKCHMKVSFQALTLYKSHLLFNLEICEEKEKKLHFNYTSRVQ